MIFGKPILRLLRLRRNVFERLDHLDGIVSKVFRVGDASADADEALDSARRIRLDGHDLFEHDFDRVVAPGPAVNVGLPADVDRVEEGWGGGSGPSCLPDSTVGAR
jgi:hypothetical protein